MKHSLVFGIKINKIEELKNILESTLSLKFGLHTSGDEQDYLFAGDDETENFVIHFNYNDSEQEWDYPEHKEYKTIFIINNTARSQLLQKLLTKKVPELTLLEIYEDDE